MTTVFEAADGGSTRASWLFMPIHKPDRFWSATLGAHSPVFQPVALNRTKKPDRYWSAPRRGKVRISAGKAAYVRRSEFRDSNADGGENQPPWPYCRSPPWNTSVYRPRAMYRETVTRKFRLHIDVSAHSFRNRTRL